MTDEPNRELALETVAAAHGVASDSAYGAVVPPLYLSTTYKFEGYGLPRAHDYGRPSNPSRDLLGEALAKLEGAVITASGMAAVDLLVGQLQADAQAPQEAGLRSFRAGH